MKPRPSVINIDCFRGDYSYERQRVEKIGADLVFRKAETEDEILGICGDADIILLEGSVTPMTARVIDGLGGCRGIVKYSVGFENVDVAAATQRGIVVANSADYCTEEVSDQTVALLVGGVRRIAALDRHVRANGWYEARRVASIRRVRNLTLGLLGMGRIGHAVARKMSGFEMRILAADPYVAAPAGKSPVEWVPVERLLQESDLISIHVPLTAETRGLIGEAAFRLMKPSAFLVNTSRGAVVDQDALVRALQEGRLGGAALDVMAVEPLPGDSPLRGFENVTLTPHTGAASDDAFAHARTSVVDSVEALLRGYWPPFPVNPGVRPRIPLRPWGEFRPA